MVLFIASWILIALGIIGGSILLFKRPIYYALGIGVAVIGGIGVVYAQSVTIPDYFENQPKKWEVVKVKRLPKAEAGLSEKELLINYKDKNPTIVYRDDIKYPKLYVEKNKFKDQGTQTKAESWNIDSKERVRLIIPKKIKK